MGTRARSTKWTVVAMLGLLPVAVAWGAASTQPVVDPEVDKILTRLEQREVHDLRARLTWRQRYVIDEEEDATTKRGRIWYQDADPVARFKIHFDSKITRQRKDKISEIHLFDGQWYTECQARSKTCWRHEVRRPDDPGDPYKVGEGVFPLPFGQKKEDILREFDVVRLDDDKDAPEGTDRLRLTPRPETETGKSYKRIDFWVNREGRLAGLPVKVQVAKKRPTGQLDSYITITFDDIELNTGFSAGVFEMKVPQGYEVIEERLKPIPPPEKQEDATGEE